MMKKISIEKLFVILLSLFHLIFFILIYLTDGYPHLNDILHIYKISAIDNNLKFLNGLFGTGYTYFSLLFTRELIVLSIFNCFLMVLSSYLIFKSCKKFFIQSNLDEKICGYTIIFLFHLILITTIGFNHTDGSFLLLFYNGLLLFLNGYYLKKNQYIYILGSLIIGLSITFRQHGPIFLFFIFVLFLLFEKINLKKEFKYLIKDYFIILFFLSAPIIANYSHLIIVDASTEFQTRDKLHYFVYGTFGKEGWKDWRDLKTLFNSEEFKKFNILEVEFSILIEAFIGNFFGAIKIVYPLILSIILSYSAARKNILIYCLILFFIYLSIITPGWIRGYYPSILICFIAVLINYKELAKRKVYSFCIFVLLFGHLFYLSSKFSNLIIYNYHIKNDINKNIVPILNERNIKYQNLFSDDFNFYTTKLEGEIESLCNWAGWLTSHPHYKDYYPRDEALGNKKKFCDVKAFITKYENIAEEFYIKGNYDDKIKTDYFYLLLKD